MENTVNSIHLSLDLYGCTEEILSSSKMLEEILHQVAPILIGEITEESLAPFPEKGVSAVILNDKSKLSLHTWPHKKYAALEYCTLEKHVDVKSGIDMMVAKLGASTSEIKTNLDEDTL
ncbi:adenosylmethionine decarboxylase [Erysipelotrichaceae bacterium]|nr:adenosylmethionine decarboxylase [Erysipelotrichaceae bacterium]